MTLRDTVKGCVTKVKEAEATQKAEKKVCDTGIEPTVKIKTHTNFSKVLICSLYQNILHNFMKQKKTFFFPNWVDYPHRGHSDREL